MIEVVVNYVCVALIVMAVAAAMVGCCDVVDLQKVVERSGI